MNNNFREEEVISFLESVVEDGTANEEQEELLQDIMLYGIESVKNNYTYKQTLVLMNKLWNEKY